MKSQILRVLASTVTIASLALPIAANAAVPGETEMRGTITALTGKYDVHVQDRRGEINDVTLHTGTIINPTGLTLKTGMRVTILGNEVGNTFTANEIDTPYHIDYVSPASAYGNAYIGGPFFGGPFWGSPFGWF